MADCAVGSSKSSVEPQKKAKASRPSLNNYYVKKRPPRKPEVAENVVYVSTKSSLAGLLDRCSKLINNKHDEVIIYALGAAIPRGILLSLQLCEKFLSFRASTNTLTSELIDDLEPATDDADYEIQKRINSAVRIRVFKTDPLA